MSREGSAREGVGLRGLPLLIGPGPPSAERCFLLPGVPVPIGIGRVARRVTVAQTQRLRARRCEWCDTLTDVEIHQVRKLADLARTGRPQPWWAQLMARMRRKTLVICASCHQAIHHGNLTAPVTA